MIRGDQRHSEVSSSRTDVSRLEGERLLSVGQGAPMLGLAYMHVRAARIAFGMGRIEGERRIELDLRRREIVALERRVGAPREFRQRVGRVGGENGAGESLGGACLMRGTIRGPSEVHQRAIRESSEVHQRVIRESSDGHQRAIRESSESESLSAVLASVESRAVPSSARAASRCCERTASEEAMAWARNSARADLMT